MTTIEQRWIHAQVGERRFHCDHVDGWGTHSDPAVRRQREHEMRQWYAGMLGIPTTVDPQSSVTDFACGPQSLLLTYPTFGQMTAVDPLRFTDEDEAAYEAAGITRVITPAERYSGHFSDEVWLYNCLQHVMDWRAALSVAADTALDTLRIFEWVGVPTDDLHLHTLYTQGIRAVLMDMGLRETQSVTGAYATGLHTPTDFYAGVWCRGPG